MLWSLLLAVGYIFLLVFLVVFIQPVGGPIGAVIRRLDHTGDTGERIVRIITVGFAAFVLVLGMTAIACLKAKWHGIKVWMDSSLDRARSNRLWPPRCDGLRNRADTVLLVATAALVMVTVESIAIACAFLPPVYALALAILIIVAVPLPSYFVGRGVVAKSAKECWNECLNAPFSAPGFRQESAKSLSS